MKMDMDPKIHLLEKKKNIHRKELMIKKDHKKHLEIIFFFLLWYSGMEMLHYNIGVQG